MQWHTIQMQHLLLSSITSAFTIGDFIRLSEINELTLSQVFPKHDFTRKQVHLSFFSMPSPLRRCSSHDIITWSKFISQCAILLTARNVKAAAKANVDLDFFSPRGILIGQPVTPLHRHKRIRIGKYMRTVTPRNILTPFNTRCSRVTSTISWCAKE